MPVFTAKNVAIFLGVASLAFCISTIVLAVQKADLQEELRDTLDKLDKISTVSPTSEKPTTPLTTTITTPSSNTSSTAPSNTSSTAPSNTTTTTTEFPWPTLLPPGLPDPEEILYRLPTELLATKYRVYLHPDLKTKTCPGTVSVQVEALNVTNLIVMHAKDVEVENLSILSMMTRMRIRIRKYYRSAKRELLIIELDELLYLSTSYTVSISFTSQLHGLSGMYASSYLDELGHQSVRSGHNTILSGFTTILSGFNTICSGFMYNVRQLYFAALPFDV